MMKGQRSIPLRRCRVPKCGASIIFLANRRTGKGIPVNPDSLSAEDLEVIRMSGKSFDVDYDPLRHQVHRYTCADPTYRVTPEVTHDGNSREE
jgi:hypothetical protein